MKPTTTISAPSQTIYQTLESIELQEQIRRRAYELYEQRGREDGRDLDDWLQAESEVTQQKAMTVAA
jgi:outer membrane protein TolC